MNQYYTSANTIIRCFCNENLPLGELHCWLLMKFVNLTRVQAYSVARKYALQFKYTINPDQGKQRYQLSRLKSSKLYCLLPTTD